MRGESQFHDSHPEDVDGLVPDPECQVGVNVGGEVAEDVVQPSLVDVGRMRDRRAQVLSGNHGKDVLQLDLQRLTSPGLVGAALTLPPENISWKLNISVYVVIYCASLSSQVSSIYEIFLVLVIIFTLSLSSSKTKRSYFQNHHQISNDSRYKA